MMSLQATSRDAGPAAPSPTLPRVCHVTTVHTPFDTRIFHKECRSLAQAGYDVHLVACCGQDQTVDGVRLHALPTPPGRTARILRWPEKALDKVREICPALVHLHDPELLRIAGPLRRLGCRVIFDVHENIAGDLSAKPYLPRWLGPLAAGAWRLAEAVLIRRLATVHVLDEIAQRYPDLKVTVRNFPWAGPEPGRPARAPGRRLCMIYVGVVGADRGAVRMIDLTAALAKSGLDVELQIVGRIPQKSLEQAMRQRIEQVGLGGRVELTGALPYAEAMSRLAQADLGLCLLDATPNYLHSLPTKVLEYMAAGVPVAASDFPAWRQYVAEVGSGVMVDVNDFAGMADQIAALLANDRRLAEMSAAGRMAVCERFCWEKEKDKLLAFYAELLSRPI